MHIYACNFVFVTYLLDKPTVITYLPLFLCLAKKETKKPTRSRRELKVSVENGSCGSREALTLPFPWRLAQTVLALFPFSTNTFFTLPLAKCGIWWQAAKTIAKATALRNQGI